MKIIYQINKKINGADFQKNFINLATLSKNNKIKQKSIKLFYLRNIPSFTNEVADIVLSK